MKIWMKVSLFAGGFIAHLALAVASVFHIINCGILSGCVTIFDRVWNQALGFPVLSSMELLSPGGHSSGVWLTILIPINSLVFVSIVYFLLRWIFDLRSALGKSKETIP